MEVTEIRKLAEAEDTHWWYRERRVLLRRMVQGSFPRGARDRVALDIGAAAGGNTRVLRDLGMSAFPVEFEPAGARIASERGLPVVRADARSLPFGTGSADLVVAFDVLEHIPEDHVVLTELKRVLRPGGALLVAVPADMALWSGHDEAVGHVRRYSREQLVAVTEAAGFRVCEIRSWNVLMRGAVAMRRKRSSGSDLVSLPPMVNLGLRAVITLERYLAWFGLGRRRGVSLLMAAKRVDA